MVCLVTRGITRWVILTHRYAFKFPNPSYSLKHFLTGWLANMRELENWKIYNSEGIKDVSIKDRLCPVLRTYLWSFIIVMPRCIPCKKEEFPEENPYNNVWGDYKIDNYGMLNSKLVCLDYGQ